MTEPPDARLRHRLEQLRHRRAVEAAARAEFETRRRHGLIARQQAKLARLAEREAVEQEEAEKGPKTTEPSDDEAA
jgi:hypothetical protein